ncbi:MAG TPA: hypothetical protein VH834_11080 [Solirubrobacteraceae bacterium]
MNLSTVEIPRAGARARAAEYQREARRTSDPDQRRELEQIARAYSIAARDEVALIALTPTIAAGGTVTRTRVFGRGTDGERREQYAVPRLAVSRWQAAFCYTTGVERDGAVTFADSLRRRFDYRSGVIHLDARLELPEGFTPGGRNVAQGWGAWTAMVPIVPPRHRPPRGLGDRLVLWEADDWTWSTVPAPPGDPALLRHVGGDLYAVEATWELTELERLVLSGRRP